MVASPPLGGRDDDGHRGEHPMKQRQLIVSTCGTSLFRQTARDEAEAELLTRHANAPALDGLPDAERNRLEAVVDEARRRLRAAGPQKQAELSAEMNGLLRLFSGRLDRQAHQHMLIGSDTWLGQRAVDLLKEVLEGANQTVHPEKVRDLRTDSLEYFRAATSELVALCTDRIQDWRRQGWRVTFNLTGGFKSVQGLMQALGMLYADRCVYVFEGTAELLELPRLPVDLDSLRIVREHQHAFRRWAAFGALRGCDVRGVPEPLLLRIDDQFTLSPWGEAVWREGGRSILEERLLDPVSEQLRFADGFRRSVSKLKDTERVYTLNAKLMDLARCVEDRDYNPDSLGFKKLHGKHDPWTHECKAWDDRDAKRLYGYFQGDVFVVDALDDHL